MKKTVVPIIILMVLFSCDHSGQKVDTPAFVEITAGGCAVDESSSLKSATSVEQDTVSYSITEGRLDLFVGFYGNCCGTYSASSSISNDTIIMNVINSGTETCDCICYYTYDCIYTDVTKAYHYKVLLDGYQFGEGIINIEP